MCKSIITQLGTGGKSCSQKRLLGTTHRHQACPQQQQQHQELSQPQPGTVNPILSMSWQSQGRHGAPRLPSLLPSEVDVCQTCVKRNRDLGKERRVYSHSPCPSLYQGQFRSIFVAIRELFNFLKFKNKGFGVRKAGNGLGWTFLTLF